MMTAELESRARDYLHRLCVDIPSRRVGSDGNKRATDLFAETSRAFGFRIDMPGFDCIDWEHDGADLTMGGETFAVTPSPYSLGCTAESSLAVVATWDELQTADIADRVVLVRGELAAEPLMPKNFPFYNPERHQEMIRLLEAGRPQAIVAATTRNPEMMGAVYPYPLFEDGDFGIPSVFTTEAEGLRLASLAGRHVRLVSRAKRLPSQGWNVVASMGPAGAPRVVFFAHIDTRIGTPGANDNASGVVTLLLLAELLAPYSGDLCVELVAMNGEDYFASPGERLYLEQNEGRFDDIVLGINLDDVGYIRGCAAYSLYGCAAPLTEAIEETFAAYPDLVPGAPWYQGDHGLFLLKEVPALAVTSDQLAELMAEITHSPEDTPDKVDARRLVILARAMRDLIERLCRLEA